MNKETFAMLDMMLRPAFCADGDAIVKCNAAAKALFLEEGAILQSLLLNGSEELAGLESGRLYLTLGLPGGAQGASVTKVDGMFIFVLDQDDGELQALALAARELRSPLNDLLAISANLLPTALPGSSPKLDDVLARMSRELYQLQRVVGNMSDASQAMAMSHLEMRNLTQVFDDIFEKASALLTFTGVTLEYRGLHHDLFGLIDMDQMERAILNVLSNSLKFLPSGGKITVALVRQGSLLRLHIQDNGPGIEGDVFGNLFHRYLRQPGIEDGRHGLGLGMVMIRSAAASHGGTVLVDSPKGSGTRVTLTMKLRQDTPPKVHSPKCTLSGGRDQALIELSQFLPPSVYKKEL